MIPYIGLKLAVTGICVALAGKLVGLCLPGDMKARHAELIEQGIKVLGAATVLAGIVVWAWVRA